jgi:hypothetical protein
MYIMGTGRSGTTILEVLLSNNAGAVGVGEVTHVFQHGFVENRQCACGKAVDGCDFWRCVRAGSGWTDGMVGEFATLFARLGGHRGFAGAYRGFSAAVGRGEYDSANVQLFSTIKACTGATTVIDSSKYAARALHLARALPDHLKVICVTRSPAGLLTAFQKPHHDEQKPKGLFATMAYYVYVTTCLKLVSLKLGRSVLHVRYEDLMSNPSGVLSRIEDWSGLSTGEARGRLRDGRPFEVGHIVTGNRLRKQGRVLFRPAASEVTVHRWPQRAAVGLMNAYRRLVGF